MKLLSAVLLSTLSLPAASALAMEASPSPLLGRWSLDITTSALPEAQRPKQVVLEFKDAGSGRWSSHVDIVLHDGKTMKSDGTLALDGTPGALSGTYGADKANLKLPAPNTLVMQLVDHGTPASTRIYTVADDRATMTETKAFYGHDGTPVLALPARGGRFYDWENNGMPDAIAPLLNEGKVQLFCADSIDAESLLAGDTAPRRRAEMQEKYFNYLTSELAPRILTLNGAKKDTLLWAVGVDTGAYQAVNCRLRRPEVFAGAIGLSGLYDVRRFLGNAADDLVLRNAPLAYLAEDGLVDKKLLAKAEENALLLCAGQGSYEGDALVDTQAMADALTDCGLPVHLEVWGSDVSHDWYWWGKGLNLFAARVFG